MGGVLRLAAGALAAIGLCALPAAPARAGEGRAASGPAGDGLTARATGPASRPAAGDAERPPARLHPIDAAVARGMDYLRSRIGADGRCAGEFPASEPLHGGRTALLACALAAGGARRDDPAFRRAMDWLAEANLRSVYAVSLRACALAAAGETTRLPLLAQDVRWLVAAGAPDGRYTYESLDGKAADVFDNSNAHAAMIGVAAGAARGVEVPADWWRRMERYWVDQQQFDGGWGYRTLPRVRQGKTYGSMTAGGLEGLLLCSDSLRREDFAPCREVPAYKPVEDGLAWLARAYAADENPRLGDNHYYYWLWGLSRVGLAVGYKHIGPHDWYAEAAAEVLRRQDVSGAWGQAANPADTAFAVMFLAAGRHGLVASKLRYAGRWNARPRDLANFAEWMKTEFERPLAWQVVDANGSVEDPATPRSCTSPARGRST